MGDLNELFANLDVLPATDVREEARRRLADPDKPTPPLRGGRGHRAIVIAVAFVVFIPAAALAWRAVRATSPRPDASVTPSQTTWDSTGQRLYIGRYDTGKIAGWRLSYWDINASSAVEVPVVVPDAVAMVAG
jgi:hypothetical protein